MGGDYDFVIKLLDFLKNLPNCGESMRVRDKKTPPSRSPKPRIDCGRNIVICQDVTSKMYTLKPLNKYPNKFGKTLFEGDPTKPPGEELIDTLLNDARTSFRVANCVCFAMCMDKAPFVPPRKEAEQKRRDDASKKNAEAKALKKQTNGGDKENEDKKKKSEPVFPYPHSSELGYDGVINRELGQIEVIDRDRLSRSRHMRPKVMHFISQHLEKSKLEPFPRNRMFILDYEHEEGPIVFYNREKVRQNHIAQSCIGEGESMCAYWIAILSQSYLEQFKSFDAIIDCDDSDTLIVGLRLVECLQRANKLRGAIWWQSSAWGSFDLTALYKGIQKDLNWNACVLAHIWCFGGNDYIEKNRISWYVNFASIMDVVRDHKTQLKTLLYKHEVLEKLGEFHWNEPFLAVDDSERPDGDSKMTNADELSAGDNGMMNTMLGLRPVESEDILREIVFKLGDRRSVKKKSPPMFDGSKDEWPLDPVSCVRFAVMYWMVAWDKVHVDFPVF